MAGKISNNAHSDDGRTFEQSFRRLQEVVQTLSEGNLTLQEALQSFEEGMKLADNCAIMLDQAELRVKQVSDRTLQAGSAALVDFDGKVRARTEIEEETELVAIEIETIESSILFDVPPRARRNDSEAGEGRKRRQVGNGRPTPEPDLPLDPLFADE